MVRALFAAELSSDPSANKHSKAGSNAQWLHLSQVKDHAILCAKQRLCHVI